MIFPDPTGKFKYRVNSFSGNEPNRFFLQNDESYVDLSPVSGVDHRGDGRGFALLDYDNDGWQDIALISTNAPRLQLYRNRFGDLYPDNAAVKIKLVGSQTTANIDPTRSNREAVGAKVIVIRKSGRRTMLHRQIGQGNVAQNSAWIWIGQPVDDPATEVEIVWPSRRRSRAAIEPETKELTLREPVAVGPVQ